MGRYSHRVLLGALASSLMGSGAQARDVCAAIPDGTIVDGAGRVIEPGFDAYGYNYQARLFWGDYCDVDRSDETCEYEGVDLVMKWNDAWLSRRDCDGDHALDRHPGYESYRGSGAWLINVMHGTYQHGGHTCHWFHSEKFVAAPLDAELVAGSWYDADGALLGPAVWGEFYARDERMFDPCGHIAEVASTPFYRAP